MPDSPETIKTSWFIGTTLGALVLGVLCGFIKDWISCAASHFSRRFKERMEESKKRDLDLADALSKNLLLIVEQRMEIILMVIFLISLTLAGLVLGCAGAILISLKLPFGEAFIAFQALCVSGAGYLCNKIARDSRAWRHAKRAYDKRLNEDFC